MEADHACCEHAAEGDNQTLRFLAVNDAAVIQYGYTRDEFLGMSIKDIRPAEDVPALQAIPPAVLRA